VLRYRVLSVEGSGAIAATGRRDPATVRITRAGILIASLGGLLVIFNPFDSAIAGLVVAVVGTVIAARGGLGRRWYWAMAVGAIVLVLSRLIAEGSETLGGWLAVIGVLCILVAAALGYPLASDIEE
jgi:hypothetical protein